MIKIPKMYTNDYRIGDFYKENTDVSVYVNGEKCPVHNCLCSPIPFNRVFPGYQRDINQTEPAYFVTFSSNEPVTLRVKMDIAYDKCVIRPLSKNIKHTVEGDEVVFTLTENGSYSFELSDNHNVLHIFNNPVKEYPDAEKATYYFGPGVHFPSTIFLKDNDTVYIDEEAIVFGSLFTEGAQNVRIYGGGILDNSTEERVSEHCYTKDTKGNFRIYNSKNINLEDIILVNSSNWVVCMFYCENINIDNIKIVGHWRYNADGIDICNSSNVTIKNSFIRSFDDTISIKGIYEYQGNIENIVVDNCVLWCEWGHTCELGVETMAKTYRNITFKNCDVIHISGPAMAIQNGNYADIHNICFENINAELQSYILPPVLQENDEMVYNGYGNPHDLIFIRLNNEQYRPRTENEFGYTHNIHFKNVNAYTDCENIKPCIIVQSYDENTVFKNIEIDGLYLNKVKQNSFDNFKTTFENTENITLK